MASIAGKAYGFTALLLTGALTHLAFKKPSHALKVAISEMQDKMWDMSAEPLPGFVHRLWTENSDVAGKGKGATIHYIERKARVPGAKTLVFVHGFPNSCFVFHRSFESAVLKGFNIVAVDIPSHGGSPGLPAGETSTGRLFPLFESFLKHIATDYSSAPPPTILAHDWGALLMSAFSAVPEHAPFMSGLILVNGVIPHLVASHMRSRLTLLETSLKTLKLGPATSAARVLLKQALRSYYIFMFRLPYKLQKAVVANDSYLSLLLMNAEKEYPGQTDVHILGIAGQLGPKPDAEPWKEMGFRPGQDHELFERQRWYREGLFEELVKIPEPEAGQGVRRLVIWGKNDEALDERVSLAGIPEEEIRRIPGGHYCFYNEKGRVLFEEAVVEFLAGDRTVGGVEALA